MADDRPVPHDLAAERAVLGAVLVQGRIPEGLELHASEYYRVGHQHTYRSMQRLHDEGTPIDLTTLPHALGDRLDEAGGRAYLHGLVDGVPRSTNWEHYARIVRQTWTARRALAVLAQTEAAILADPSAVGNGLPRLHAERWAEITEAGATTTGLPADGLDDAVEVVREGQQIETAGVPQLVDGLIPAIGMLGFLVAYAKVGKSTFAQSMAAHVAMGREFLGRATQQTRVLVIPAEDPPEYSAWMARHLDVAPGAMTYYRRPILFDRAGLGRITATVREGGYGFVWISSWQAVVRGLIRDENDNAGAVAVVEAAKMATRATGVPWLVDAHSGKGEDQTDDADPLHAMRGASAAAGAADYMLSLRYANGAFGTQRRLSGKGRFVGLDTLVLDYDPTTGIYTPIGATKDVSRETTWRLIIETGALTETRRSVPEIARAAGLTEADGRMSGATGRRLRDALHGRPDVLRADTMRRGQKTTTYARVESV